MQWCRVSLLVKCTVLVMILHRMRHWFTAVWMNWKMRCSRFQFSFRMSPIRYVAFMHIKQHMLTLDCYPLLFLLLTYWLWVRLASSIVCLRKHFGIVEVVFYRPNQQCQSLWKQKLNVHLTICSACTMVVSQLHSWIDNTFYFIYIQ